MKRILGKIPSLIKILLLVVLSFPSQALASADGVFPAEKASSIGDFSVSPAELELDAEETTQSIDSACTLHVSPDGSDANPGTEADPFQTIQKAADVAMPGDVVCVQEGKYTDIDDNNIIVNLNRGGTEEAWITFRSEVKWGAVLDGENNKTGYCWNFGSNANFVLVENFEVLGCANGGFWSNSAAHHVTIKGNHVHHIGRRYTDSTNGIAGAFQGNGTSFHTYEGNVFHHNGRLLHDPILPTDPNHDHGIYIYGTDSLIQNNIFYAHEAGWGIQLSPGNQNIRIINNTFAFPNPNREGHIVIWGDKSGILIQNNLFYQSIGGAIRNTTCTDKSDITILNNLTDNDNLISGDLCDFTIIDNISGIDPGLVDPPSADFHLNSDSPAIDNAAAEDAPEYDFDGTLRPQGSRYDIGAYEYGIEPTFMDVPTTHWAYDAIEALYQAGYVAGCSEDPLLYCPESILTRAESAVFVERGILGADTLPDQPAQQTFADVPLEEWFAKWANALWDDGYTSGCGTDPLTYCPLQDHTRAEGSVFFLRMMHGIDYVPPDPAGLFADVPAEAWYADWAEAAFNAGIIPACETEPELRFCPDDPLDRAMAAYMMVQAKGLSVP
jgi:hypothetical protein